ncbi:MAG: collagen binding domain-containing protein, partial [Anaerolineae bacterium]
AGVLTPESPVYLLRLPDTVPVSAPSGESRAPGTAHLLPVSYCPAPLAQTGAEPGWYVDDVVVQEATPPPLAPICDDLTQAVNYADGGYAPPCSGISPVSRTLKLVDSRCNPIADARVNLRKENGGYVTYRRTDADGVADFSDYSGSAVPSLFEVDCHGGRYRTAVGSYDTGAVVQTREYHLQFIGSDCAPLENARVNLRKSNDGYVTYVRTDGEGVASFQVVPEAQMKLELDYHGARWRSEAHTANLDVVLGAESFRLLLLDSGGGPIENARVNLRKANDGYVTYTRTGDDGLASFDVAPGGELKLEVDYHGAKYATPASTSHAQESVQTLAFSLRLTDSTGQPIENARVNLRKASGGYVTYARTGADGVASFEVVPQAQMKLQVDYHGATYATEVTEVSEDTQLEVQTLAFGLRLVDNTGQPIEDARVNLRKANDGYVTYARTGADGVASFEVVPGARMRLEVDYHGATYATPVTEVSEDMQLEVQTVLLTAHLTVQGTDLANQRVDLLKSNEAYVTYTRTGSDGSASFEVLPGAAHKLRSTYDGETWVSEGVVGPAEVEHDFD